MRDGKVPARLKRAVFDRAKGCCEYCHSQVAFAVQPFSVEHIRPRCHGGKSISNNLALACQGCNNHKYNKLLSRDPIGGDAVPFFNPRNDKWSDHFFWNNDFTQIVGRTPVGRAMVEELDLNRPGAVNLRRVLFASGDHPPDLQGKENP